MSNHFHLVVQTPQPNLSRGMHWLNGTYAAWFNAVHRRSGHLFQGRFHSVLIEKDSYFATVLRYVVLNPVRAKIVARAAEYRWSSFRATCGLEPAPAWLDIDGALAAFGDDRASAVKNYLDFVDEESVGQCVWSTVANGIFLGGADWLKAMRQAVESKVRATDHPRLQRAVGRPDMPTIIGTVARAAGTTPTHVRARGGGRLRRLAAWIGWHEGWLTLASIAAALRLRSEGHISNLIRRCDSEFASDATLLHWLDMSLLTLRV